MVSEERGLAYHCAACHAVGIIFIPLAIGSLGGMSDMAAERSPTYAIFEQASILIDSSPLPKARSIALEGKRT